VAVAGDDVLVEVAHGAEWRLQGRLVESREELRLVTESAAHVAQEVPLIDAVCGLVERGRGWREIHEGRDTDDGFELRRRSGAVFAEELENEIATHGVADEDDGFDLVVVEDAGYDFADVCRAARVIDRGREMVRAAATAHVHADDVAAGGERTGRIADDVLRTR